MIFKKKDQNLMIAKENKSSYIEFNQSIKDKFKNILILKS